ncbi:Hexose_transporter [Hexamita inflata]|uniref:Hexose_transporter n=1 Tax=Hexamita inflata TaxID=28002 RepID=A0ABP1GK75_9EUKA
MQKLAKTVLFMSSLIYGVVLTNLPIEIFNKISEITHFDCTNPTIISFVEFGFLAGATIGCITTPIYTKKFGYIKSIRALFLLELVASGLSIIPLGWIYLSLTRVLSGIFACALLELAPQYVAEVLTPQERSFSMMMFSVALNLGNVISYAVHLPISFNYDSWCVTFIVPMAVSFVGFICAHFLVKRDKPQVKSQADDLIVSDETANQQLQSERVFTKLQIFRLVCAALMLGMTQTVNGVDAILTYASNIFADTFESRNSGIYGSLIIGGMNVAFGLLATPIVDRCARKLMLSIGVLGVSICLILISIIYKFNFGNTFILILVSIYLLFFNMGPQPIVYMLFGEMFPQKYKIKLNALGFTTSLGTSVLAVFSFAFFTGSKQYLIYLIYGIFSVFSGFGAVFAAPETFGKTLDQIEGVVEGWRK